MSATSWMWTELEGIGAVLTTSSTCSPTLDQLPECPPAPRPFPAGRLRTVACQSDRGIHSEAIRRPWTQHSRALSRRSSSPPNGPAPTVLRGAYGLWRLTEHAPSNTRWPVIGPRRAAVQPRGRHDVRLIPSEPQRSSARPSLDSFSRYVCCRIILGTSACQYRFGHIESVLCATVMVSPGGNKASDLRRKACTVTPAPAPLLQPQPGRLLLGLGR
jgi:hypothetical protein